MANGFENLWINTTNLIFILNLKWHVDCRSEWRRLCVTACCSTLIANTPETNRLKGEKLFGIFVSNPTYIQHTRCSSQWCLENTCQRHVTKTKVDNSVFVQLSAIVKLPSEVISGNQQLYGAWVTCSLGTAGYLSYIYGCDDVGGYSQLYVPTLPPQLPPHPHSTPENESKKEAKTDYCG